jgi:hypothetical protein
MHLIIVKYQQHLPSDKKAYARDNESDEKAKMNKSEERVVIVMRE